MGPEKYDPGDTSLRIMERNRQTVASYRDGPIDIIGLRQPSEASKP
jgi:hypothetical protein